MHLVKKVQSCKPGSRLLHSIQEIDEPNTSAKDATGTLFSQDSHIYALSCPLSVTSVHNHMQSFHSCVYRQLALMSPHFDLIGRRQNRG